MRTIKSSFLLSLILFGFFCSAAAYDSSYVVESYNAGKLEWKLWSYTPEGWRNNFDFNNISGRFAELRNIPVNVPGSVQKALLNAGIILDWNYGQNNLLSEWITNRSWIYITHLPDEWLKTNKKCRLIFKGLDGNGTVLINGKETGTFNNAFIPYTFDITAQLKEKNNTLAVVFGTPPTYLGQVYWTSKIKEWKPRFNYGWDWVPRIVQIGIWDDVLIETYNEDAPYINYVDIDANAEAQKDIGILKLRIDANQPAMAKCKLKVSLSGQDGNNVMSDVVNVSELKHYGKKWAWLKVKRWWTNGDGKQELYNLNCTLLDEQGSILQKIDRKIGFKSIQWLPNKNAPENADHWLCSINNKPVFLQGINWTPMLPNFADLKKEQYVKLLRTYKELGINMIRIWGGGFPEYDWLYNLCDEFGILIQQDFPLSSSGLDNYPPETTGEIKTIGDIATHYIRRNKHHVSMLLWCGGNELYEYGDKAIVTEDHPMIRNLSNIVKALDPERRFVPGSPSGANIWIGTNNMGKGINWDVHGPWGLPLTTANRSMDQVREFWQNADALMYSEVGVPGAMNATLIKKYADGMDALPANHDNPLWNRVSWWIEWDDYLAYLKQTGEVITIENYVKWSQERQAEGYAIAAGLVKKKFPEAGGMLIWMGHDCYPCFSNNSIIDFEGNLKPAAIALQKVWKN